MITYHRVHIVTMLHWLRRAQRLSGTQLDSLRFIRERSLKPQLPEESRLCQHVEQTVMRQSYDA